MDEGKTGLTYADAGVDIKAGDEAVRLMRQAVQSTFRPEVLTDIGGFGGLFGLAGLISLGCLIGFVVIQGVVCLSFCIVRGAGTGELRLAVIVGSRDAFTPRCHFFLGRPRKKQPKKKAGQGGTLDNPPRSP